MMGRIWLAVLYLSGWNISTCLLHQFHYVADPKNWTEAQAYCREKYRDLATIRNTEENNQLIKTSSGSEAWIGLYSPVDWRWSDGYNGSGAGYRNWIAMNNEPNFYWHDEFCGSWRAGEWADTSCCIGIPFICNNENELVQAPVRSDTENQELQSLVDWKKGWSWIGLFRDPNMFWSDGSSYSFSYWSKDSNPIGLMSVLCAASLTSGRWKTKSCETRLPFVCSSTTVRRQVVKLRIKPEDSSVDLNDPAVNANILKKIQDRLMEKGVSGVTLRWREQPNGKVFHKEGKRKSRGNGGKLSSETEVQFVFI